MELGLALVFRHLSRKTVYSRSTSTPKGCSYMKAGLPYKFFWQIRKKLLGKGGQDEYDTITEDNITLTEPNKTKNHIADYFEDLYQAREGEQTHEAWTNKINNKITELTNIPQNATTEAISIEEVNKCIKQLQRGKSNGPDNIPNETLIEANQSTRKIITNVLNSIYESENIPEEWQEGEIIRFYKGKGKKGKCSNERGITLGSNMGKLFERIMNNRLTKTVNISDAQAGGQKGKATADHLLILNTIIKNHKKHNKKEDLHIAFLDVTKAYDKAWLNAILYALNRSGLAGKDLNIVKNINKNLTATIRTKYGNTRKIKIRDSIRQGGVLSVIEYANLIDEIAKEINMEMIGTTKIGTTEIEGCLLWMDDVALIHKNKIELQKMLDITDEVAKRYHVKFGQEKSQTITIGKNQETKFKLGDMEMDNHGDI